MDKLLTWFYSTPRLVWCAVDFQAEAPPQVWTVIFVLQVQAPKTLPGCPVQDASCDDHFFEKGQPHKSFVFLGVPSDSF